MSNFIIRDGAVYESLCNFSSGDGSSAGRYVGRAVHSLNVNQMNCIGFDGSVKKLNFNPSPCGSYTDTPVFPNIYDQFKN